MRGPIKALKWKFASRWILAAEASEGLYRHTSNPRLKDHYARRAMECYAKALRWWPLEHARQLPPPSNLGAHPADEMLFPEATRGPMIPCILCGALIPQAMEKDGPDAGKYCARCAAL